MWQKIRKAGSMKIETVYNDEIQNKIEEIHKMQFDIQDSILNRFRKQHSGDIAPTEEDFARLQRELKDNIAIKGLEKQIVELIETSIPTYILTAENEEDKKTLENFTKSKERENDNV